LTNILEKCEKLEEVLRLPAAALINVKGSVLNLTRLSVFILLADTKSFATSLLLSSKSPLILQKLDLQGKRRYEDPRFGPLLGLCELFQAAGSFLTALNLCCFTLHKVTYVFVHRRR